jgi:hypothetical protein
MTTERKPMIKLAELWQRESKSGNVYYSGFMNGNTLLLFDDGEHPHPTREGEVVRVWKLLLQERDTPQRQAPSPRTDRGRYDDQAPQRHAQQRRAQRAGEAIAGERDPGWPPPIPDGGDDLPF